MQKIITADALQGLQTLPDGIADMCVTSPPYYGLRDYGTGEWEGGDPDCDHSKREETNFGNWIQSTNPGNSKPPKSVCHKCGAVRVDRQIGLEESPQAYIDRLVGVFAEVKRVLKDDGTLWVVIGDSFARSNQGAGTKNPFEKQLSNRGTNYMNEAGYKSPLAKVDGCKPKDLIGIPWMLAFALRADGYYLRQDIIWHKPNPMPESVNDRCTKSHEYVFLFSKSPRYYFNSGAMKEIAAYDGRKDTRMKGSHKYSKEGVYPNNNPQSFSARGHERWQQDEDGNYLRNRRDVWTVPTKPYSGAHFAVFPPDLIRPCVLAGSRAGGIVLDPFLGSGTTAAVAVETNRNYIGVELNPEYVELANRRIDRMRDKVQRSLFTYEEAFGGGSR